MFAGFKSVKQSHQAVNSGKKRRRHARMNNSTFIVKILQSFQNVFREAQDEFERKPWVVELSFQTRNTVAKNIHDEANVLASKTLE
jgi:hypothetical protein